MTIKITLVIKIIVRLTFYVALTVTLSSLTWGSHREVPVKGLVQCHKVAPPVRHGTVNKKRGQRCHCRHRQH